MIYLKYRRDFDTEDGLLILIIAEKPSLGRNIASALGVTRRGEGCMLGDQYIVTWAFGHLFSLADIEAYLPKEARSQFWTMDNLPCFPEKFQFHLRPATTKSGKRSRECYGVHANSDCCTVSSSGQFKGNRRIWRKFTSKGVYDSDGERFLQTRRGESVRLI